MKRREENETKSAVANNTESVQKNTRNNGPVFFVEEPKYTLDDIILPSNVKEQILDVADYAHNSKVVFEDWGLEITHKYSKRM